MYSIIVLTRFIPRKRSYSLNMIAYIVIFTFGKFRANIRWIAGEKINFKNQSNI